MGLEYGSSGWSGGVFSRRPWDLGMLKGKKNVTLDTVGILRGNFFSPGERHAQSNLLHHIIRGVWSKSHVLGSSCVLQEDVRYVHVVCGSWAKSEHYEISGNENETHNVEMFLQFHTLNDANVISRGNVFWLCILQFHGLMWCGKNFSCRQHFHKEAARWRR